MANKVLTIVVPCYDEQEVLHETSKLLKNIIDDLIEQNKISSNSKILFVNDGSKDKTWEIIEQLQSQEKVFTGIRLSRNFGHQNAVMAGLSRAVWYSDMMITIDADLQDDIQKIYEMVDKFYQGFDIVYGVRNNRDTDTGFKRTTAEAYYWLMTKMGVNLIPDHADYRLMSKRAVEALLEYHEENLFLRGIVPELGFNTTKVYYKRKERFAGESHYPLKKMLGLAIDGITSFTIAPIKLILYLGILMVLYGGGAIVLLGVTHHMSDYRSLINSLWLLGGIQLITLSIIGTYVGKVFNDVKKRPRFIIEDDTYSDRMKKIR
ncbi:glycosyltransferase family 2 protein [Lactobacillus jensenii]|jgi:bactoprenol glucosyl transferase|uniref:Glycosyltransferase family 2 protein n=1 Tax=Lactobacillus jensenii TaxID=109790 RepID=A0A5N1IHA7_LACJE|nr:glycosyltransferase family 2 protein [Lactobacillus jensenii]EEQ68878.1 glycosyltransferase, group 2 family protein [Lactobacillus jensenii 1153]APT14382.1 glycosyltransferase [Lactobacillus jensenii]EEQ25068.1 glycosyltransferase, group 2 family protein [Lactobacillus jensenii 269-3]EEX28111.1 putative bactoprenol glucosyl transferase-like protein [Lactobacillus jensenii SJ-7A-US]KAA9236774.1 glycosyltransferase family 2 protein [Lactobacillus jensenii]